MSSTRPAKPAKTRHPVDQVPPPLKLGVLGIQHVLAFYAGAVIVPLVIAKGLNLTPEDTIHLINADLFTCGIATLIQCVGITKWVGVRLPIIQGVTTTAVAPIIAIGVGVGKDGAAALPYVYGAVIASGLFTLLAAPIFAKLLRFFPPVVTGTVLLVMGTSLLAVSAGDFTNYAEGTPALRDLAYGFGTLTVIVLVQKFARGFTATISVLIGLVLGTGVAIVLGDASFDQVGQSAAFGATTPFYFGIPQWNTSAVISLIIVMLITMVETTGDVFATGEIVKKRINKRDVSRALRADGLSTMLGGIMNSFPYTCFAQNVGLVRLTRVKSRWVAVAAAVIMILIGLVPKAGAVVASIPAPVLGGASIAMFANVAWVGLQTIAKADLTDNRNSVIVTTALGLAMLVSFKPDIAQSFPHWAQIFFGSGMTIGAITAIILNFLFFHVGRSDDHVVTTAAGDRLTLSQVNAMDQEEFVDAFRSLFNNEVSPLHTAWQHRPFKNVLELRSAIQEAVVAADRDAQNRLLADYPDMGELLGVGESGVSDGSSGEGSSVEDTEGKGGAVTADVGSFALADVTDEQAEQIKQLCDQYRKTFGFPFIARLETADSADHIIRMGLHRIENSAQHERNIALSEIVEIANDRLDILLADANPIRSAWERNFSRAQR